jgi:3-dehydroquinate synthase
MPTITLDKKKFTPPTDSYVWKEDPLLKSCKDIWQKALALQLKKNINWDLSKLSPLRQRLFAQAATYYLRGVCCYTSKLITPISKTQTCVVKFCQNRPLIGKDSLIIADEKITSLPKKTFFVKCQQIKNYDFNQKLLQIIKNSTYKKITIVGGGALSDVAAFSCSLAKKEYELIPTTLLSAVDASLGGKTGVNLSQGKNLIGSFYLPTKVHIWSGWFESLKEEQIYEGASEALKHILILNNLVFLKKFAQALEEKNFYFIYDNLELITQVKIDLVNEDPFDQGKRKTLNLGHTLAHALEAISLKQVDSHITHGKAVAIGLVFSVLLSRSKQLISKSSAQEIIHAIVKSQCLVSYSQFWEYFQEDSSTSLWQSLQKPLFCDKKNNSPETISWVLLNHKNPNDFLHSFTNVDLYNNFLKLLNLLECRQLSLD